MYKTCHFEIRVGKENLDTAKAILEETGVPFNHKKEDLIALSIHMKPFSEYKEKLSELIRGAWEVYS